MRDEAIIAAIRGGDEAVMDHVINQYAKLLWSVVRPVLRNVGTEQDMEECVADVFVYLWSSPEKYRAERGTLKSWLALVARTQAIDKYRVLSKNSTVPLDDATLVQQVGICEGLLEEETKQLLLSAVRALEEPRREILVRRFYYEQKPREIAAALKLPVKQVENHLYRAKQTLRDAMTT